MVRVLKLLTDHTRCSMQTCTNFKHGKLKLFGFVRSAEGKSSIERSEIILFILNETAVSLNTLATPLLCGKTYSFMIGMPAILFFPIFLYTSIVMSVGAAVMRVGSLGGFL
jgi:hypothetical protein